MNKNNKLILMVVVFICLVLSIISFNYIKYNFGSVITLVGSLLGISLTIILIGLLLYRRLVYKNAIIQGKLSYWKESDTEIMVTWTFDFSKLVRDKIIITFNEENENDEFYISNDEYNYDIELTAIAQNSKFKFFDGYKALLRRNNWSELLLRTTEPGIFIYEGKVFTSKKIYNNDMFTTGGYVFRYFIDDASKLKDKDKGKNVLKGS